MELVVNHVVQMENVPHVILDLLCYKVDIASNALMDAANAGLIHYTSVKADVYKVLIEKMKRVYHVQIFVQNVNP